MRRTTELLSEIPRRSERRRGREAAPRGRLCAGVVLVTAFAAFSTAGSLMPEAAGAAEREDLNPQCGSFYHPPPSGARCRLSLSNRRRR